MGTKKFDEVLEECLNMLRAGVGIDDCVAPYPQWSDALRARLVAARTLAAARPQLQPDPASYAQGRASLLAAVTRQAEAPEAEPILALLIPFHLLSAGARRLALVPHALPVALALLLGAGALTAAAAVLQPDVPGLGNILGERASSSRLADGSQDVASPTPTGSAFGAAASSSADDDDEPRIEFKDGECELRGQITSLDPLIVNGVTVDDSSPERVDGDLAQALAAGSLVRVKGTAGVQNDERICIAREIKVEDDVAAPTVTPAIPAPVEEPRIEFRDGTCELRGPITSLDPLAVNGVSVDDSSVGEVRGDLAQAFASGASVRVKGTFTGNDSRVCVATEIRVEDEAVAPAPVDQARVEFRLGECDVRGVITSLDPLAVGGVSVDDSSAQRVEGDLAQAFANGTSVRVKGAFVMSNSTRTCVATEIKVED